MRRSTALVIAVIALLALAEPAAAASGEQVGENVGKLLGGWAQSLYVGIAAVTALVFLLNRKFAEMGVFLVAAILVGGFVFAPQGVADTVTSIWRTIAG